MLRNDLDWKYINWQEFQTLCISIAETIVPDCNFQEYLKPGQKQEGIDLLSFNRSEGKNFCIQCKREKSLSINDIKTIIAEFATGDFFNMSSHFVIATSADLQTPETQKFIAKQKVELYSKNSIIFDCWDVNIIQTNLKKRYDLVAAYFGESQAKGFCNPQMRYDRLQIVQAVKNYIPRKIIGFSNKVNKKDLGWYGHPIKTFDLIELLTKDRSKAKRICVIGDAYQGKSTYIQQTVYSLQTEYLQIQPIFISIKEHNVQPISDLLSKKYGSWREIPLRDIILIIDGLDEVPTEKFSEIINHIKEFALEYQPVSIIFSCRKLFYTKYNVSTNLSEFDAYDLLGLQQSDIENYGRVVLGNRFENFKEEVTIKGISNLLYHPFYLINIVDEYNIPPHQLPGSKIKVVDTLINKSFDINRYRKIKGSESVKDEMYRFNNVVEKFAFGLQLAGLNSFTGDEISQIFTSDERLLLQHNSLVTHTDNSWSFVNALFQEHIAARKLAKMEYEDFLIYCTVGTTIKKVRTKWIQTLSSLLSILDSSSSLFAKVFEFIENDNIELLFQTESSKYDETLKLSLLKKLLDKCIRLNIRPMIVYEDSVGIFIQQSAICKQYLLGLLFGKKITKSIRIVCCRMLRYSMLNQIQQKEYAEFVLTELSSETDAFYAANLIQVFTSHKFGDIELIDRLLSNNTLNKYHEYRDEIYELITILGLVDKFYNYGLSGLTVLAEYNKDMSRGGSEYNLKKFLVSSKKPANISMFLSHFESDEVISFFENHSLTTKDFITEIFNKLSFYFEEYPYLIFPIADLFVKIGRKYVREEFKVIDSFLDATNSHWLLVRILIEKIFKDTNWEIGSLITPDSYDYVLFEFEEGDYEPKYLMNVYHGLRYKEKSEIADGFFQVCVDVTEGAIINKEGDLKYEQYKNAERKKLENDLKYIQSLQAFRKGIKKYFSLFGKNTIPTNDLYIDIENNFGKIRQSSDSYFLYYFLIRWQGEKKSVNLQNCLNQLKNEEFFEIFQAEEILHYSHRNEESNKVLLPIIESYFFKYLKTADFRNCIWYQGDKFHLKVKEYRLGEIFQEFGFDMPEKFLMEFVWLDQSGTRGFETARLNRTESISQKILKRLSNEGLQEFKNKIVENINLGIKHELVFGTHIELCKHLKIIEARDSILINIKSVKDKYTTRPDAVDAFLELGGNPQEIISILKTYIDDYNDYYFTFLVSKFYKTYPNDVIPKMREAINNENTTNENKITLTHMLAELGDSQAFAFLVNEVRITRKAPYNIQSGRSVAAINTKDALSEISDLIFFLVDRRYDNSKSFHDSAKSLLLEWLYSLAAKSESDLLEVILFLERKMQDLKKDYEDVSDINWYINRMLEEFRGSDKTTKQLPEIMRILVKLDL